MDDRTFWDLIARIDRAALEEGDEDAAVEPLRDALIKLPPADIEGFEEVLARKLFALDGRRYAAEAGPSGNSDDGFLYRRCFVVALGKEHYEAVLADPSEMPKSIEEWCEALLAVAAEAYEASTGGEWTFLASVNYETGSNHPQWQELS